MADDLHKIDYLILDILLDDIDSPEDILRLMNNPDAGFLQENSSQPFSSIEIEEGLSRLLDRRLVVAMEYSDRTSQLEELDKLKQHMSECWFKLTPLGKEEALKPFPWN